MTVDTVRTASTSCLVVVALAALAAVASWGDVLLVALGLVVPGWATGAVLLVVALVLVLVLAARRSTVERAVSGLVVAAAGLGCVVGALDDVASTADYRVLQPAGPHGCTAVVRETSFLKIGNGEVYAVGPTGVAMGRSGTWVVDDGYRPVAEGTYDLHWGRDGGTLAVRGTEADPVIGGGLHDIDCGWGP